MTASKRVLDFVAPADTPLVKTRRTGDAFPRLELDSDGEIRLGDGTAEPIVASFLRVIEHGDDPDFDRPPGVIIGVWKGTATPNQMIDGDFWLDEKFTGGSVVAADLYALVQEMATAEATAFSGSARTFVDYSENGRTATEIGFPTEEVESPWGAFGNARDFVGTTALEVDSTGLTFAGASPFTVEAKYNPRSIAVQVLAGIWTADDGAPGDLDLTQWILYVLADGSLNFTMSQSDDSSVSASSSAGALVAGGKYDVAAVYDPVADLLRLFVNGVQVDTTATIAGGLRTPTDPPPFSIGAEAFSNYSAASVAGWPYPIDGPIDEVRISSVARYDAAGYVPSIVPFTADADTEALYHLNEEFPVAAEAALTVNGNDLSEYDYLVVEGDTVISAFEAGDWFSLIEDSRAAFIVVKGNLTIDAGQTLTPAVRKLFTVLYVTGNLVVNGGISMTRRGANHSGTGSSGGETTATEIRIATGTFSTVVNPNVPAAGGAGGVDDGGSEPGSAGSAGAAGGTGGGGTGGSVSSSAQNGAAGSSFSGGPGSGGVRSATGGAVGANGGKGGDAAGAGSTLGGGAGNPGGAGADGGAAAAAGTGGVLVVFVEGDYSGTGTVTAAGAAGGGGARGGGGSGGGSVTIMVRGTDTGPVPSALGGAGGAGAGAGGNGGAGTARKLALT